MHLHERKWNRQQVNLSRSTTNLLQGSSSIADRSGRVITYPQAPPSFTASAGTSSPVLHQHHHQDQLSPRSTGLGYYQPRFTETHLPSFHDDMNLHNLRSMGLSNSDSVTANKRSMLITSPQPSVDSGLKVDGSSVDLGLRSTIESRESVARDADSRSISRVTSHESDSNKMKDNEKRNDKLRTLAQSLQETTIVPKGLSDLTNSQQHTQPSMAKSQPGETEITTSITKTTIPEETESDGMGGLKVKRPAMSRLVLEQQLQSSDRSRLGALKKDESVKKGTPVSPMMAVGDGCTISSSVTLESPYQYKQRQNQSQKMASMKDLTFSRKGEEETKTNGENGTTIKPATSMDSIPKKRSKSCHSYTLGGSTPGIGTEGMANGRGGGEVITTSKFERHKSPQDGRGREETTWEYSMECNCVNGVNTSLRTSVKHKRTFLPFAYTMYESSV